MRVSESHCGSDAAATSRAVHNPLAVRMKTGDEKRENGRVRAAWMHGKLSPSPCHRCVLILAGPFVFIYVRLQQPSFVWLSRASQAREEAIGQTVAGWLDYTSSNGLKLVYRSVWLCLMSA